MKYRLLDHPVAHQQGAFAVPHVRPDEWRFRQMAETVPQIVWITDAEGRAEFLNRQWRTYTGIDLNPATAAEVAAAAVHPDDVALTMQRFDEARASGRVFEVEHRIRGADGVYRWFLVRAEPHRNAVTGEISQWFGASVNIDDRKQAEHALHTLAARQSFQLLLADAIRPLTDPNDVIAVASELLGTCMKAARVFYGEPDASSEFIDIARDWVGAGQPSMSGQRLRLADFGQRVMDDMRAGRLLAIDDVTRDEKSASHAAAYTGNGVHSLLAIPLLKDGRLRAILNVHRASAHHWTNEEMAMADDMVDRTWAAVESARSQARLRAERDLSRSVFANMTEGFALLSADWTVLEMNEPGLRIGHRSADQVVGRKHWDVWPEARGTEAEQRYRRAMTERVAEEWEYQQGFPDGSTAWIEVRAYPVGLDNLAVFFRDITERKVADQSLKDADRRKDEFLAMLAHELRNPLAPIGAAAQLLQMGKADEARVRHSSQIISRQVRHMTHLIDDLLDVSRVTRGLVELEKTPLDIRHIVVDAVEQVSPLVQARNHHLSLHLPPDSTAVLGDRKRLVQVLANILNNAAKYTAEGGQIALKAYCRPDHVVLEVSDNGIGMAPDLAAHAFDLFAQAERTSDRSAGGLGLGLALVKHLVELHGGTVSCRSEGIGKGSSFEVCLPRIAVPGDGPHEQGPRMLDTAARALRIMIVDDNVDAADMLGMMLETLGHEVAIAHGSRDAIEQAAGFAPDVYLLDIGLPGMDGNELARHLRQQPASAHAVLIAVTGYGQAADRQHSLEAGFDHHLVKPVDLHALASLLAAGAPAPGRP